MKLQAEKGAGVVGGGGREGNTIKRFSIETGCCLALETLENNSQVAAT